MLYNNSIFLKILSSLSGNVRFITMLKIVTILPGTNFCGFYLFCKIGVLQNLTKFCSRAALTKSLLNKVTGWEDSHNSQGQSPVFFNIAGQKNSQNSKKRLLPESGFTKVAGWWNSRNSHGNTCARVSFLLMLQVKWIRKIHKKRPLPEFCFY